MNELEAKEWLESIVYDDFAPHTQKAILKAIEAFEELQKYKEIELNPDVCQNYKLFEDELISKGITFNELLVYIDKLEKEKYCDVSAKWIPVLERLPDKTGYYRCSVEWFGTSTKKLLLKNGHKIENRLMDIHFSKSNNSFKENTEFSTYKVTAWKPLEEPYIVKQ